MNYVNEVLKSRLEAHKFELNELESKKKAMLSELANTEVSISNVQVKINEINQALKDGE